MAKKIESEYLLDFGTNDGIGALHHFGQDSHPTRVGIIRRITCDRKHSINTQSKMIVGCSINYLITIRDVTFSCDGGRCC
jgi:hypothetical protein